MPSRARVRTSRGRDDTGRVGQNQDSFACSSCRPGAVNLDWRVLKRQSSPDGVVYYVSPLLEAGGVPHAFSTRLGGVSAPPFDALNLGNPGGSTVRDSADHIAENYCRLHRAIE